MTPEEIKRELRKALDELNLRGFEGAAKIKIDTDDVDHLNSLLNLANSKLYDLKSSAEDVADGFKSIADTFSSVAAQASGLAKRGLNNLVRSTAQAKSFQDAIVEGYADEKRILDEINKIKRNYNIIELDGSDHIKNNIKNIEEQKNRLISVLNVQKDISYEASRQSEFYSNMSNSLSEIPIIGKNIAKPFKNITEELRKSKTASLALNTQLKFYIEEKKLLLSKGESTDEVDAEIRALESRIKILPSLRKILSDEVASIININNIARSIGALFVGTLVKEFKASDKSATELARKFNMSKSAAFELRNNIRESNIEQGSYLTTTEDVLQTMMSMLDVSGRRLALNGRDLATASELLKVVGLSEKATAGLAQMSRINNTSLEDTEKSILGSSVQLQAQTGLFIDNKQLLEDIGNLSNILRIKFKGNTDEMALTVTRSKQLGFSMEALSGIQDNILNFESSISAELEAELLTGKELNLEKARYYALTNQQSKLQDEIVRQVGTLNEFEGMNVFQQKAYAQALGMSVDDMSKILLTQEENQKIQQSINKDQVLSDMLKGKANKEEIMALAKKGELSKSQMDLLGEATGENLRQLSIQEKMEKTMTRLSEIFLSVMDPILAIVDVFDKVVTAMGEAFNLLPEGARKSLGTILGVLGGSALALALTRGATPINPMFTTSSFLGGGAGVGGALGTRNMAAMNKVGMSTSQKLGANFTGAAGSKLLKGTAVLSGLISGFSEFSEQKDKGKSTSEAVGRGVLKGAGAGLGTWGGASAGAALGAFGGPLAPVTVPLGALIGGIAGGWGGGKLADLDTYTPMATGGIVTEATIAMVGEAGSEAVLPLDAFYLVNLMN
jgi:uncharacterized protein YggU (UPF0235/DUF167 family)